MGEFVAITGESGSGKSTLLRIISGMDTFDDGELYVDGQPTFQYDEDDWEEYRRTKIGFVFQDYSLIGHYTAKENIVSALLIMGVPEKEAGDKAIHYLERVGLSAQRDQRASKLSSGQSRDCRLLVRWQRIRILLWRMSQPVTWTVKPERRS